MVLTPEQQLLVRLATAPAVLVTVDRVSGSVPREQGAWMAVFGQDTINTVGGGRLEFDAIQHARDRLREPVAQAPSAGANAAVHVQRYPLGPALGQCCGGVVHLRFESVGPHDIAELSTRLQSTFAPLALFGGGHVGRALITVLGNLPFKVLWVDSRDEIFPPDLPANVRCEHSDPVHAAVAHLPSRTRVLIMSFSHAQDLDIVAACLQRQRERSDLVTIGLIGSKTKWAQFTKRLDARGFSREELAQVTCPIGLPGIQGKQPQVIAVAVAAQLLMAATS